MKARHFAALVLAVSSCQLVAGLSERTADTRRACTDSSDCEADEVCLFKICSVRCVTDVDCKKGFHCLDTETGSACVSESQSSCEGDDATECPDGTVCSGDLCRTTCGVGNECRTNQVCTDEVCVSTGPTGNGGSAGSSSTGGSSAGGASGGTGATGGTSAGTNSSGGSTAAGGDETVGDGGAAGGPSDNCLGTLPGDAPPLVQGDWTDLTPGGFAKTTDDIFAMGLAIDPCDPATLYWTNSAFGLVTNGVYKTTNAGSSWAKVGDLDGPNHIAIDPDDPQHLYATDGVRGSTFGFWVSTNGGVDWDQPHDFTDECSGLGISGPNCGANDAYDLAVDPSDFSHVLVSSHNAWDVSDSTAGSGVFESTDGGDNWVAHGWPNTWGYSNGVNFLYSPDLSVGDSNTWLVGSQATGMWRTANGGDSWDEVTAGALTMAHGGGTVYYTDNGTLFVSGTPDGFRSTDNGYTWQYTTSGPSFTIFGDGTMLYTMAGFNDGPFLISADNDGLNWTAMPGSPTFTGGGAYEMVHDSVNGILYASIKTEGIWALKL